jgi:phage-related protein
MAKEPDVGVKIGIEGEKEFKVAINDIKQSFKVLASEMKLAASEFDKNDKSVQSVAARNAVLNKEIDAQKDKIATLAAALANASESFGESDNRTKSWAAQLNNAKAELNDMERELSESAEGADDLGDELKKSGEEAEKSGSKFEKLDDVLKGIGKAMAAVAVAAGAAAMKLGKEVVSAYADYEQLVGGVDTLFGKASQAVQSYAENAFKTAGLSANEYMETVTGFSASLIQSLGGDTAKAAQVADMAITDMADNANKMGSNMTSIQDAYQGFAKQNYTMLDNLKLGYGGTKTEMERLLADAEKFSGIKYDISSYSDVAKAIHVIQTEMGITGTTAKEATETITGSVASMQSAIGNLMAGLGNANADIGLLIDNMVEAFQNVTKNITPVIENIVSALPKATGAIISAVGDLLPTLLETVTELFTQVLNAVLSLLPELIPAAVDAIMTITRALIDNLPLLIDAGLKLVTALIEGVGDALPELIPAAVSAITTIVKGLVDNLPMLLAAALKLIVGLAQGLVVAIPQLVDDLPKIIEAIIDFFVGSIPEIVDTGVRLMVSMIKDLPKIITAIVSAIPKIITSLVTAIVGNIPQIVGAGVQLLTALITNLPTIIFEILKAVPQIIAALVNGFKDSAWQIVQVGGDLIKGLWQGISDAGEWLRNKISGFFGGVVDSIKSFFGINSPSKLFAGLGENMAAGLGVGFGDEMKKVGRNMQNAIPTNFDTNIGASVLTGSLGANTTDLGYFAGAGGIVNNFNVSAVVREEADINKIASRFYKLQQRSARGMGVTLV